MLVLASGSPRRRELLTQAGFQFRVAPSSVDEALRAGESAIGYATRLAGEKAAAVLAAERGAGGEVSELMVLGADTTVVAPRGEILGKPEDDADAARMLRLLSGATHTVVTGVAVATRSFTEVAAEVTYVTMRTLSPGEIARYVATGEPRDKAGAYAIQGHAARWIPRIHGCYFNVVGLPLALVCGMVEGARVRVAAFPVR